MMMEDSNCTLYLPGKEPVRAQVMGVNEHGFNIAMDYNNGIHKTIVRPGIPPHLIDIDDNVKVIRRVVSDIDLSIDSIRTIEYDVANWQWRNADVKCGCDSINYNSIGYGLFRCNDCGAVFEGG